MTDKTFLRALEAISSSLAISNNETAYEIVYICTKSGQVYFATRDAFCNDINTKECIISGCISVHVQDDSCKAQDILTIDVADIESITY